MRTNVIALLETTSLKDLSQTLKGDGQKRIQRLFPIMDAEQHLLGVMTRKALQEVLQKQNLNGQDEQLGKLDYAPPVVAYPDEPLRAVVYRMAETGFTRFPVVERENPQKLLGIVSLTDLLKARTRNLEEERQRERMLHMRFLLPRRKLDTTLTK